MQKQKNKGNLLLIFLFTSGLLGILVTGIYFLITGSAVQQSFIEAQGARRKVEKGLDEVYKSELERLVKDYISNSLSQTLVASFTSSPYQTALASAVNWAFDTGTLKEASAGNPGSLSVTMPDQVTYPVASKANTVTTNTNFREHPLSLMPGYDAEMTLSGTFTPTWNNRSFAYSRKMVAYREIPACYIPFSAAYATGNVTSKWETLSLSGGPVALFAGDNNHANAVVADSFSTLSSAPNLPNLVSTYGVLPENICSTTSSGNAGAQQQYRRDASVRVISFNGSTVTPATTGVSLASFDGRSRCTLDISSLNTGLYTKYFINCLNQGGQVGGVVIKDTGAGSGASASVSIATNGPLNIWQYKSSSKTPIVVATSYGVVNIADSTYTGSGTPPNPLDFTFNGHISAYSAPTSILYDVFGRTGALASSTPTYSVNSLTWNASSSGVITCANGSVTSSGAGAYTGTQYGVTAGQGFFKGPAGVFVTTTSFANGKSMSVIFATTSSPGLTEYELKAALSGGGALTTSLTAINGGVATADSGTSTTPSYSAGTHVWGFIYSAATNEVFITLDGALALKKKLTAPLTSVPTWSIWKMDDSITATRFEVITSPFGTLLSSPQTRISGTDTATIYGSMATGSGIASSLDSGATLNFTYKSTVADALKALCERVIVHYPYFYKP